MKTLITTSLVATIALTASAQAVTVYTTDFTDDGTYTVASLNGQDNWSTDGGINIQANGAYSEGYKFATNSAASTVAIGETYTSTITFTYNDLLGTSTGPHIGASLWSGSDPSSASQVNVMLKGNKRFSTTTNWGNAYPINLGFNQSGTYSSFADIGIDDPGDTDSLSDTLQLSIAMTAGADTDSWTVIGTLYNVDTATTILSYEKTGVDFAISSGGSIYGGISWGQSDSNQNVSDRVVSGYTFATTVPEPSTFALIGGLCAFGFAMARRRP